MTFLEIQYFKKDIKKFINSEKDFNPKDISSKINEEILEDLSIMINEWLDDKGGIENIYKNKAIKSVLSILEKADRKLVNGDVYVKLSYLISAFKSAMYKK